MGFFVQKQRAIDSHSVNLWEFSFFRGPGGGREEIRMSGAIFFSLAKSCFRLTCRGQMHSVTGNFTHACTILS